MPIYPLVAVLIGLVIERCALAQLGSYPRRAWHQFQLVWGMIIGAGGLLVGIASLLVGNQATRFYQPRWFGIAFGIITTSAVAIIWSNYRRATHVRYLIVVGTIAIVAGISAAGLLVNVRKARWIDPTAGVGQIRDQLPPGERLVSFSPIEHRFAYYFCDRITELDWPRKIDELPPNLNYFCFKRTPGDTADCRASGRGRTVFKTPGTLPFAWQEIKSICVERQVYDDSPRVVVLGRVVRPIRSAISDVTKPQSPSTQRADVAAQSRQRK
jgi:hypothetical protein